MEPEDKDCKATLNLQSQSSTGTEKVVTTSTTNSVLSAAASGLLASCESEVTQLSDELRCLNYKQQELIDRTQNHNEMLAAFPLTDELAETMKDLESGLAKLGILKQNMATIHDRADKLRERAEKLRAAKVAAELKEEELLAKLEDDDPNAEIIPKKQTSSPSSSSSPSNIPSSMGTKGPPPPGNEQC